MANQLSATIVNSDGSSFIKSFSTEEVYAVQGGNRTGVNSIIYDNGSSFLVAETISQLFTQAGNAMFMATQLNPSGNQVPSLFSSVSSAIGVITGMPGIASYILFKGRRFYCIESRVGLATSANANSGNGGSGYLPDVLATYDSNADAVTAIGVGKMYMSSTLINGSPIILLTV